MVHPLHAAVLMLVRFEDACSIVQATQRTDSITWDTTILPYPLGIGCVTVQNVPHNTISIEKKVEPHREKW